MPVCARCFGLYAPAPLGAGLALAAGAGWLGRRRRMRVGQVRALLLATGLPTVATWTAEWLGVVAFSLFVLVCTILNGAGRARATTLLAAFALAGVVGLNLVLVAGKTGGRKTASEISFYNNNAGMGVVDVSLAAHVYRLAVDNGLGKEI